jgi:Xaa-Pro aminopeptidase
MEKTMLSRRDLIKGSIALGTAAIATSSSQVAQANWGMPEPSANHDGRALVNPDRIDKVLTENGLDGLIAVNPVNVFYLTNHLGFYDKMQRRDASFAIYPKDKSKPSILVVGSGELWTLANNAREYPHIIPYSLPANWQDFEGLANSAIAPQAYGGLSAMWGQTASGLSDREKNWIAMDEKYKNEFMPTPEHALVKALKEAGLENARVAIDDVSIQLTLARAAHDKTHCIEADNIFRKIRVVKSEVEIVHMSKIAKLNQTAAMNMLASLDKGATNHDMDHLFRLEAAKQGAMVTWLVGGSVGGFPNGELEEGVPFLIDAVSQCNYYHGDFARTVVLGEPSQKVRQRTALLQVGWHAALEMMRPGVKYSEIEKAARHAMNSKSASLPPIGIIPHSVGLQHTDEPYKDNLPFLVKEDLVLEENMTLTVDFPCLELGWGNCHLEDLVRVTKDGVEPLATIDDPLVVI